MRFGHHGDQGRGSTRGGWGGRGGWVPNRGARYGGWGDEDGSQLWSAGGRGFGRKGGWPGNGYGGRSGGRGGRGPDGRLFAPGDLRLVLLSLLSEQPRHGYELIRAVEQLSGGAYVPSPGSIYPMLTLLEELAQIRALEAEGGTRKLFQITDGGRAVLQANRALLDAILVRLQIAARSFAGRSAPDDVLQAMLTIKTAVQMHAGGWSDEERTRVCRILNQAAAEISTGGTRG